MNYDNHEVELTEADKAHYSFFRINVKMMEDFMKKINRLNNKAKRIGCAPIKVEVLGQYKVIRDVKETDEDNRSAWIKEIEIYNCVTIEGEAPKYNGWKFVASLEHTPAGNIVRTVPDLEIDTVKYREVENYCEHCNSRRQRKQTFILVHEDGTTKQVGRNCIADFLGNSNPERYGNWFDMMDEAYELANNSMGGGGERAFILETYMAYVVECIERFGWVSGTHAREQREYYDNYIESSGSRALRNMLPPRNKQEEKDRDFDTPSDESYEKAKVIVAWGKALKDRDELNDYLHNLTVIANGDVVTWNKMSFAASMANAYRMDLEQNEYKKREAKEKAERPDSEYFGEVGKRETFTLTVERVIVTETFYGISKIHIMRDEQGNVAKWFSSNKALEEGETYELKATVKEHSEYKGEKQTVLTRCAVQ